MTQAALPSSIAPPTPAAKLRAFAADIKISHTIFAMPWAILAAFLAAVGWPHIGQVGLIVACMVFARTVAMAANRLLDARLDALNPRTARRAIPSGALSRKFFTGIIVFCTAGFMAACYGFEFWFDNRWPLLLGVPVLLFISLYPLLKRFTRLCHYYLGLALALAPICAWVAIAGSIAWPPIVMAGAVLLWTAGFDIIYACQDLKSDLETGVVSVPARLGLIRALWVARITHVGCAALLITIGLVSPAFGVLYFTGAGLAIVLLAIEHALVWNGDLSKVGLAFFTINGIISVVVGALGVMDVLL